MIEKVRITGYRKLRDVTFKAHEGVNMFVGDNESGKSTILEALGLALTCRINGRPAQEELNPFWFNRQAVAEFFAARARGEKVGAPEISIEIFFKDDDKLQGLRGAINTEKPVRDCPGMAFRVIPNSEYSAELNSFVASSSKLIPVEFYKIEWNAFTGEPLLQRPRQVSLATIDSRTIRSTTGIDYHVRQMLSENIDAAQKTEIAAAYRAVKEQMTEKHLKAVNDELAKLPNALGSDPVALGMDQTSRSSWDSAVVPHLADVPFAMSGQGQQAAIKIVLAMGRHAASARMAMVEEPENHLSHSSLNKLLSAIEGLASDKQQLFITTHSSYVLNRLGLDRLQMVSSGSVKPLTGVTPETVRHFQKLPGYDTLRVALAGKVVMVEGPSDEVLFERIYHDLYGHRPIEDGIDVLSVRGLSFKRFAELAKLLGKTAAIVRDLDKNTATDLTERYQSVTDASIRLFIGLDTNGKTLEPQLLSVNKEADLQKILKLRHDQPALDWMTKNKTEAALRIAEASDKITPPAYIADAAKFIHG